MVKAIINNRGTNFIKPVMDDKYVSIIFVTQNDGNKNVLIW